ncbi:DUF418 domain-containing protein [Williamsia sp. CHRR-6]|uniref:DUF418 domain-containing protein n=1 Tax=Williamsia sp. CHRR-6 TaxID=2835871 RepID=UPI001BDB101A|nr:DUF418 domain-containing protein [Williamsia sp. CHRR-6]MBT0567006.1 DUF418 domain-containing protein [Williamsia sp. CHRR-6]
MTRTDPATAATTAPSTRLPTLDVLRGLAILGTLASNIWFFTISVGSTFPTSRWDVESLVTWLPNGKFLALLTILFGVGITIQQQAARQAERAWPGTYLVRCVILFLDGLINYYFVITFDVLRVYAVVAFVVAFLVLFSDRLQWLWLSVFAGVHGWYLWHVATTPAVREAPAPEIGYAPVDSGPVGPPSWLDTVRLNLRDFHWGFDITTEFQTLPFFVAALFLLGGLLYRRGIFEPRGRVLRYWSMAVGFGVCLPADFVVAIVLGEGWSPFGRYGFAAGVALALLATIAEVHLRTRRVGRVGRALALVGRMALSCYLLQNILALIAEQTFLRSQMFFYANRLVTTVSLWAGICVILIAFCAVWLRFFDRGPMEQIWRWAFRAITTRRSA